MQTETMVIIGMSIPAILGGLKILSRLTKTTVDDKIIDAALKICMAVFPSKK